MPEPDWVLTLEMLWGWLANASPWLAPLGWIAAAVVLIILWVKLKGWAKVKAVAKWFQKAIALVDQLLTLPDDVKYIKGQLSNNGGSTVKDVGQATARKTEANARAIARVEKTVKAAAATATEAKATADATQQLILEHLTNTKE